MAAVEIMVNRVHLWETFEPKSPAEHVAFVSLAERIGAMWKAKLGGSFPGEEFEVTTADDPIGYGPTITFSHVGAS
ncbi:hypothetical protein Rhe02_36630 [Rhizocola hellebori]|uniref:Uncharacterized protein n=1 Tax=Rhizocola hellebori TaxID=1392758 RepID=A0A8J3Q826_9ACTN|nr:hypothetical protein Rhe02_36630 [Rhizocola hellebori]